MLPTESESNSKKMRGRVTERAHPDLNQGPADLQSAALATELCTQMIFGMAEKGRGMFVCLFVWWDKNRRRLSARGSQRTNACRLIRAAPPASVCKRGGEAVRAPPLGGRSPGTTKTVTGTAVPLLRAETRNKHWPSDPDCPPPACSSGGARPYEPPRMAEGPRVRQKPLLARPSRPVRLKRETNSGHLTRTACPRAYASGGARPYEPPPLGGRSPHGLPAPSS